MPAALTTHLSIFKVCNEQHVREDVDRTANCERLRQLSSIPEDGPKALVSLAWIGKLRVAHVSWPGDRFRQQGAILAGAI